MGRDELGPQQPEWRTPAEQMKMPETHIVPLSRQAAGILRELVAVTELSVMCPRIASAKMLPDR
jgi:integrase